jgi:WhiB family redox-sensing transcriptional regulator
VGLIAYVKGQLQLFVPTAGGWGHYELPVTGISLRDSHIVTPLDRRKQIRLVSDNPEPEPVAPRDLSWMDDALCADPGEVPDPDVFFPDAGARTDINSQGKSACVQCTVRVACLEYGLETKQRFGIWGAKTRHERRRIAAARVRQRAKGGDALGPDEAQQWLRMRDPFLVDAMAAALQKVPLGEEVDWQLVARQALDAAADLLDDAETG